MTATEGTHAEPPRPDPATHPDAEPPEVAGVGLETLLGEVLTRVEDIVADQQRARLLLDAVIGIAADLSLDSVLGRIVRVASELVGAHYAALGVLGSGQDRPLRAFIYHGVSESQRLEIGDLPRGHGLLGQIIDDPHPLRLHDLTRHPNSYGVPELHPPMHSFLGVPVRIRDRVFGNLYLTEKSSGGDFTDHDEAIVVGLAAAAGVAIENARLYEEAGRREQWLSASTELTSLLTTNGAQPDLMQEIVDRATDIAGANAGLLEVAGVDRGSDLRLTATAPTVDEATAARLLAEPVSASAVLPLGPAPTADRLTLVWADPAAAAFAGLELERPRQFAYQIGLALQVSRARKDQERLAIFEERDRIARDLHDLVIQRLFAIGLGLENTSRLSDQPELTGRISDAVDDLDATIKDVRRSIFALGSSRESTDIRRAIAELVDRAADSLGFRPVVRFEGPVNSITDRATAPQLLAVLNEALSNTARHAGAASVQVTLSVGEHVRLTVEDDGRGFQPGSRESGLRNMRERAHALGGAFEVDTEPGAGTTVTWRVPTP